jgi:hypothetical protein
VRLLRPILLILLTAPARADEYNYQNLLVGTRSSGMGGTDVAFADSVTGAYSNPAGIVDAPTRLVSVSLSAYRLNLSGFANIEAKEGGAGQASGLQFNSFPLSFGLITGLGDVLGLSGHTLGLNFFVEDNNIGGSRVDVRIPEVADLYLRVRQKDDETIQFGPAWAARRGRISLGLGVAYQLRVENVLVDTLVRIRDSVTYRVRDTQALHGAILGRTGVLLRLWRGLRVGASVTTPGARLHGTGVVSETHLRSGTAATIEPSRSVDMSYRTPWKLALGLGYLGQSGWRLGADLTYHSAIGRYQVLPGLTEAEGIAITNLNVGAEIALGRRMTARLGGFTNLAASPEPPGREPTELDDPTRLPHVDYFGATCGLSLLSGQTSLDLSAMYQYGTGEVPAEAARGYDPARVQLVVVMVGGTYAFGDGPPRVGSRARAVRKSGIR